ncbi:hypothetical protein ACOME3_007060 [Neoechinorhynchus agilis]
MAGAADIPDETVAPVSNSILIGLALMCTFMLATFLPLTQLIKSILSASTLLMPDKEGDLVLLRLFLTWKTFDLQQRA